MDVDIMHIVSRFHQTAIYYLWVISLADRMQGEGSYWGPNDELDIYHQEVTYGLCSWLSIQLCYRSH